MPKMITSILAVGGILALFVIFCAAISAREAVTHPGAVNVPHLISAIAAVENTPVGTGPCGEISRYQITKGVWDAHSDLEWTDENGQTDEADRVAIAHVHWIRARLMRLGLQDTPHDIALVWKAGYGHCLAKRIRPEDRAYARRVANVYEETK